MIRNTPLFGPLRKFSRLLSAALLVAVALAPACASAANEVLDNGLLRFGNGTAQPSVNNTGNLQGPMYHDNTLNGGGWFYLTISNNPLDMAIGVGGDGTSNWNVNGSISENQALTGQVIDASGYVRTGPTTGYGRIVSTGRILVGSNSFELRTTYTLGATDAFVKITTRITNDGASPIQNLRFWVGTHDDWIGQDDVSQKQRGNLVNGVFTPLSNAATRAEAIQISSGASGVLFYTTSPRGYTSVNRCCSFRNVYNQNPATAAITVTNDGSYAMFVRMNDLAIGQSDEFDWFYAAGELANLSNIAAAVGSASSSGPVTLTRNVLATPFTPVTISGGTPPYSYAISPALPAGLSFNTATGEITGTPSVSGGTTTYTVTITDAAAAVTSGTFNMTVKDTQSISFSTVAAQVYAPAGTFTLTATATSGLTVNFASQSAGVCAVSGSTVTMLSAGACIIRASQAGDGTYLAAADVDQSVAIGQANQTIAFPQVAQQIYINGGTFGITANSSSGLGVSFSSLSVLICSVTGTTVIMQLPGSCIIRASQSGNANYAAATAVDVSILIGKLDQTITFPPVGTQTYASSATFGAFATASSGLLVTFTSDTSAICTVAGNTVTILAAGTCTLRASQAGNATYNAAMDVLDAVGIAQAGQTINFGALANAALAGNPLAVNAAASSGLAVSFSSQTPSICSVAGSTVTMLALGSCTVRASQPGDGNYQAAVPVERSLVVTQAVTQVVLSSSNGGVPYGTPVTLTLAARGFSPTGRVDFMFSTGTGFTPVCSAVALAAGLATCDVPGSFLRSNPAIFIASYGGDTNNLPAMASHNQGVNLSQASISVTVNPQSPVVGRDVTLSAMVIQARVDGRLTFSENGVPVSGCSAVPVVAFGGGTDIGGAQCVIHAVSAGAHTYVVTYPNATGNGFDQEYVSILVSAAGPEDYSGMWWAGQAENGWGMSIDQHGDTQFALMYVYDNSGNPIFYAMPGGTWNAARTAYTGSLYQPTGSPFSNYDASKFAANAPVGTMTISYTSNSTATLNYQINGISGTKQITREVFSDNVNIHISLGDMWWGGSEQNGWGMNISHQGSVLFPVWYTYDDAGKGTWYTMPGGQWNGATYTGDLYRSISSAWLGVAYDAGLFKPVKVGQISLTFIDENAATVVFNVNGVVRTGTISRQPY